MYEHRQIAWAIWVLAAPVILILGFMAIVSPVPHAGILGLVFLLVLFLFGSLTVVGEPEKLKFYFGPGIVKKHIPYNEIKTAEKVRNQWYYGWGIRWYGRGWLYNVSGLDAVELTLASGKQLRIGTDEPDKLLAFLGTKIGR
jgi:hypothetical protein